MSNSRGVLVLCLLLLLSTALIGRVSAQSPLWTRTNGPGGAAITAISFDSSGAAYVLSNAAYRTTDDGITWQQLPLAPTEIKTLPDGKLVGLIAGTIELSADQGMTWAPILNINGPLAVTTAGEIYVTTATHAYRSTNEGANWDTLIAPPIVGRLFAFATPTVFLLSSDRSTSTLYRTTDHGASWSKVVNGLTEMDNFYGDDLAGAAGGVMVYVCREARYVSTDDGRTWNVISSNNDINPMVAISPQGVIGVTTGPNLEITDLTGKELNSVQKGFLNNADPGMDDGNRIVECSPSGEFWVMDQVFIGKVNPASQTAFSVVAPPSGSVTTMLATSTGEVVAHIAGWSDGPEVTAGAMMRTTDGGTTWAEILNGVSVSPMVFDSAHTILGAEGGGVTKSTNNGGVWNQLGSALTNTTITSIVVDPSGIIYCGSGEGVFRSTDAGNTWDQLNLGMSATDILSLAVNAAGDVFAGTSHYLFESTDQALSWHTVLSMPSDSAGITSLVFNTSGDLLAVEKTGGISWSHDNGLTWSPIGTGLTGRVNTMLSTPSGHVFAGTDHGVYYLAAGGSSWTDANAGLTNPSVLSITRDAGGTVYLGTDGSGVFRSTATYNLAGQSVSNSSSATMSALRSYPNPASTVASLSFSLSGNSDVSAQIFNELGERVSKVDPLHLSAGPHNLPLDIRSLPAGVYQAILKTHAGIQSTSLVLKK